MSIVPSRIDIDHADLVVTWPDRHETRLGLIELRRDCPCATCTELRAQGKPVWPRADVPETIGVEAAELAGGWGLSIRWNDRHETGIYTWDLIRSWCGCRRCRRELNAE
jgi:DUF971 family protein